MLLFAWFLAKPVFVLILDYLVLLVRHPDAVGVVPLAAVLVCAPDPKHLFCLSSSHEVTLASCANIVVSAWVDSVERLHGNIRVWHIHNLVNLWLLDEGNTNFVFNRDPRVFECFLTSSRARHAIFTARQGFFILKGANLRLKLTRSHRVCSPHFLLVN